MTPGGPGASEKPILFSGPMVRAILEGRKTQTRRLVKLHEPYVTMSERDDGAPWPYYEDPNTMNGYEPLPCPYGEPGHRLWVRETTYRNGGYVATDPPPHASAGKVPSIFMRRHDSRITLAITGVRAQRLGDISEDDARAEGVTFKLQEELGNPGGLGWWGSLRQGFAALWDSINGDRAPWKSNPWVWVVSFAPAPTGTTRGRDE
jgi:hypothetical protein